MKKYKNKQTLQILAIVALSAISIILIFFPDLIDNKYKYSYDNISVGKQQVATLNDGLLSNEMAIINNLERLESLKAERNSELLKKEEIGFNEEDLVLSIPSLLIELEQNAVDNKSKLTIDYNAMQTQSKQTPVQAPTTEEELTEEEKDAEEAGIDLPKETALEKGLEERQKDEDEDSEEEITITPEVVENDLISNMPVIEGVDVTAIPIEIVGSYSNVRNYIKYLDEIGMIEPSSVNIQSKGKIVQGNVILNVFHREEDE